LRLRSRANTALLGRVAGGEAPQLLGRDVGIAQEVGQHSAIPRAGQQRRVVEQLLEEMEVRVEAHPLSLDEADRDAVGVTQDAGEVQRRKLGRPDIGAVLVGQAAVERIELAGYLIRGDHDEVVAEQVHEHRTLLGQEAAGLGQLGGVAEDGFGAVQRLLGGDGSISSRAEDG